MLKTLGSLLAPCTAKRTLYGRCRSFASTALVENESSREARKKLRNQRFDEEVERQARLIPRIEKIEVVIKDVKPEDSDVTLVMNKDISTPFDCVKHIHELYLSRSVVAELDDGKLWDMHRPLTSSCSIRLRHFMEENPYAVNQVFWRSCSFVLGMVVETAFKDSYGLYRHSWPKPNINSGSFLYDFVLPQELKDWEPSEADLRTLTSVFWKIKEKALKFERLEVVPSLAKEIFSDNKFKSLQIDSMSSSCESITLYRLDDHIDISVGPMIANSSQIGRATVASVHPVDSSVGRLHRFQGVALPQQLYTNHFTYNVLIHRAKELNHLPVP